MLKVTTPMEFYNTVKGLDTFTVSFKDSQGKERLMPCTLNVDLIPQSKRPKNGNSKVYNHLLYFQIIRVFDLSINEWRTIKLDRAKELFIRGRSYKISIKDGTRKVLCACGCGEEVKNKKTFIKGHNSRTIESRQELSGRSKGNMHSFKYGCADYRHRQARRLFGKNKCERCGIEEKVYVKANGKRFDMHCVGGRENYHIMTKSNWKSLCHPCHLKEHDDI